MESSSSPVVRGRGFSLVELLVVLAIITIITTIVLVSQSSFNRSTLLTSTAYTIALSVREAQSLGLSSRLFGSVQNAGYGAHFATANRTSYSIFSDINKTVHTKPTWCPSGQANSPESKPGNCLYDNTAEIVTTYSLNKGFSITDFCGLTAAGVRYCSSETLTALDITFLRPNTESIMTGVTSQTSGGGFGGQGATQYVKVQLSCAVIWIQPPSGSTNQKCIVVSQIGQVSVPQACPAVNFTTCP